MRQVRYLAVVASLLVFGAALAQEKKPAGGGAAEFDKLHKQFTALVRETREIQIEYRLAKENDRAKLRDAFHAKMAQAKKLMSELSQAGLAAYKANPRSEQLRDFVLQMALSSKILRDNFEETLRLSEVLIENIKTFTEDEQPAIYTLGGVAAFEVGRLDVAEKYLTAAGKDPSRDTPDAKEFRKKLADEKKYFAEEEAIRKAEAKADGDPQALPRVKLVIANSKAEPKGEIIVELFENEAPNTVANFISLVEKKFYDGLTFHRVIPNFAAQGGCPKGDGTGDAGYKIPCECYGEKFRRHLRGSLSMAHAGKDTGGSQFFITLSSSGVKHLDRKLTDDKKPDGGHTVFGRVISGFDVLGQLQRRDPQRQQDQPVEPDKIVSATVIRKRNHAYVPKKVEEPKTEDTSKEKTTKEKGGDAKAEDAKGKGAEAKPKAKGKEDTSKAKETKPKG
jgi:cyclophilin family peptidyl-prolyl cis-trans isomerase